MTIDYTLQINLHYYGDYYNNGSFDIDHTIHFNGEASQLADDLKALADSSKDSFLNSANNITQDILASSNSTWYASLGGNPWLRSGPILISSPSEPEQLIFTELPNPKVLSVSNCDISPIASTNCCTPTQPIEENGNTGQSVDRPEINSSHDSLTPVTNHLIGGRCTSTPPYLAHVGKPDEKEWIAGTAIQDGVKKVVLTEKGNKEMDEYYKGCDAQ